MTYRNPNTAHLLSLFDYRHLPNHLQPISDECNQLAHAMVASLNDGPELSAGLRKLVEAKDWFVRQAVKDAVPPASGNP